MVTNPGVFGEELIGIDVEGLGHSEDGRLVDPDVHKVLDRLIGRHETLVDADEDGHVLGQPRAVAIGFDDVLAAEQLTPARRGTAMDAGVRLEGDEGDVVPRANTSEDVGEGEIVRDLDTENPLGLLHGDGFMRKLIADENGMPLLSEPGEALGLGLEGKKEEEVEVPGLVMLVRARAPSDRNLSELLVHTIVGLVVSDLESTIVILDISEAGEHHLRGEAALRTETEEHLEKAGRPAGGHLAVGLLGRASDIEPQRDGARVRMFFRNHRLPNLPQVQEGVVLGRFDGSHPHRTSGRTCFGLPQSVSIDSSPTHCCHFFPCPTKGSTNSRLNPEAWECSESARRRNGGRASHGIALGNA